MKLPHSGSVFSAMALWPHRSHLQAGAHSSLLRGSGSVQPSPQCNCLARGPPPSWARATQQRSISPSLLAAPRSEHRRGQPPPLIFRLCEGLSGSGTTTRRRISSKAQFCNPAAGTACVQANRIQAISRLGCFHRTPSFNPGSAACSSQLPAVPPHGESSLLQGSEARWARLR